MRIMSLRVLIDEISIISHSFLAITFCCSRCIIVVDENWNTKCRPLTTDTVNIDTAWLFKNASGKYYTLLFHVNLLKMRQKKVLWFSWPLGGPEKKSRELWFEAGVGTGGGRTTLLFAPHPPPKKIWGGQN